MFVSKVRSFFCSKSKISYENIFSWQLVLPQTFIWRTNMQIWTRCQKNFFLNFWIYCKFKFFERFYLPQNASLNMYNAVLTTLWKIVLSFFEFNCELKFTSVDFIFLNFVPLNMSIIVLTIMPEIFRQSCGRFFAGFHSKYTNRC